MKQKLGKGKIKMNEKVVMFFMNLYFVFLIVLSICTVLHIRKETRLNEKIFNNMSALCEEYKLKLTEVLNAIKELQKVK